MRVAGTCYRLRTEATANKGSTLECCKGYLGLHNRSSLSLVKSLFLSWFISFRAEEETYRAPFPRFTTSISVSRSLCVTSKAVNRLCALKDESQLNKKITYWDNCVPNHDFVHLQQPHMGAMSTSLIPRSVIKLVKCLNTIWSRYRGCWFLEVNLTNFKH